MHPDSGDGDGTHPKVETIAEHRGRRFRMAVGVVTKAEVQDATLAVVWAHMRNRRDKPAVTRQLLKRCEGLKATILPDVVMGRSASKFLPDAAERRVEMPRKL